MNEPSLADSAFDPKRGLPRGTTLRNWAREMAAWIRKQGVKQLVFVGDVRCMDWHSCCSTR